MYRYIFIYIYTEYTTIYPTLPQKHIQYRRFAYTK